MSQIVFTTLWIFSPKLLQRQNVFLPLVYRKSLHIIVQLGEAAFSYKDNKISSFPFPKIKVVTCPGVGSLSLLLPLPSFPKQTPAFLSLPTIGEAEL